MLRLETLGGLSLSDDGRHLAPPRRQLAVLGLLAAAGERGIPRDKLIACLWSESAAENARHALEQLVYSLRRLLAGVLAPGPDPLRLNQAAVTSDVADFAARLASGDLSGAVAVYRGPFLDGFFLTGAPEFDRWVERERARLAGEYERALRGLADRAEHAGRHTEEIDYKRRLALADPLAERAAAELVRALATAEDWAGATRAAREYMARAREELPGVAVRDLERLVERLREERLGADLDDRNEDAGIARYQVERELGRGAAAIVYLAHDRRFDRPVALKLLRPEVATATDARRFRREIRILARLYHPHILQLYDSGVMPPGASPAGMFYVMPYVRGETLRERLRRDVRLPMAEAAAIAAVVADALAYAHAQGVIHRDIRPENILFESGHALVGDFGIAAVLETAGGERLSATGVMLGEAAYASPEQARGEKNLDGRSDIYSLGCVLYEMLGGEPPFSGAHRGVVLARHLADAVPSLRTLCPDLPAELERVVLRALAKQPEARFASGSDLAAALRARSW
jgi:DNA-binding SARP family transcriptional activator/tRNA A-37 threonylcarbamoyl transferase component Bud32